MKSNKWAVSLGIPEWKRNILLLMILEVDEDGNWGWVSHGRIDALRRTVSGGSRPVLLMSSTTSVTDIWALDPKKFSSKDTQCHIEDDTDGVIAALQNSAKGKDFSAVCLFNISSVFVINGMFPNFDDKTM